MIDCADTPAIAGTIGTEIWPRIRQQLRAYVEWIDLTPACDSQLQGVFETLTDDLAGLRGPPCAGLSAINASGVPFQWSVSIGSGPAVRWLCETGPLGQTGHIRALHAMTLIDRCLQQLSRPSSEWLREVVMPELVPPAHAWPEHWRSAIWVGVGATPNAVAIKPYFNLNYGEPRDRWMRIGRIFAALGWQQALGRLCDLSSHVSQDSWPVGLAFDVSASAKVGRIKVYFRGEPSTCAWLERWYGAVHGPESFSSIRCLLDAFPYTSAACYPPNSFVISLEFYSTGEVTLKCDLGVTRWLRSDADVIAGVKRVVNDLRVDGPALVEDFLVATGTRVSSTRTTAFRFVGLGLEPDGSTHVNVYVEPTLAPQRAVSAIRRRATRIPGTRNPEQALTRALGFLTSAPGGDQWVDFKLPVGVSDEWPTAFVLLMLADLAPHHIPAALQARSAAASAWLERRRRIDGGWGYNADCGMDSDTSSLAMLALLEHGRSPMPVDLALLARHVNDDGGVRTYLSDDRSLGSWSNASTDVEAVACRLLRDGGSRNLARRIARHLDVELTKPRRCGFWWLSPHYADAMAARYTEDLLAEQTRAALLRRAHSSFPLGAFEMSLLLRTRCRLGEQRSSEHLVRCLVREQCSTGSFAPSAWLRLTHRHLSAPGEHVDAGRMFVDENGVFTTAAAIAALSDFVRKRQSFPDRCSSAIQS